MVSSHLSDMVAGEERVTVDLGETKVVAAKVLPEGLDSLQIGTGDNVVDLPTGKEISNLAGESPLNVMASIGKIQHS